MITPRKNRTVSELSFSSFEQKASRDKNLVYNQEYCTILEVDLENCRVRVEREDGKELRGPSVDGKELPRFCPLITPLNVIHSNFGPLVPGMKGVMHWVGEIGSENLITVEIISNNANLIRQDFSLPELDRGFSVPI